MDILGVIGSVLLIILGCLIFIYQVADNLRKMGCGQDTTKSPFRRFLGVIIGLPIAVAGVVLMAVLSGIQQGTITLPKPEPTLCVQCFNTPHPFFPLSTATPTPYFHFSTPTP